VLWAFAFLEVLMGKLTLTLHTRPEATHGRTHILTRLRRCGARLVGSTVVGTGDAATEIFEFATNGRRKRKRPARPAIGACAGQQARLACLEAVARMGIALSGQPLPLNPSKEESVRKVSAHTLVLGKHEPEARQIYALAKRLVRGEGPPDELRMPRPAVTIVPCGSEERPRDAWGVGGVGVAIEMRRPYPPVEAMVVAGYILLGLDWPQRYRTMRLPAALDAAYAALERHFEAPPTPERAALVTIPKPVSPAIRPAAMPPLVEGPTDAAALPSPTRQQLPSPTDTTPGSGSADGDPS
jgi:hypothetical protein